MSNFSSKQLNIESNVPHVLRVTLFLNEDSDTNSVILIEWNLLHKLLLLRIM
jgi:hypothetical protein